MLQFAAAQSGLKASRLRSNLVMLCHLVAGYLVELMDVPPFLINIYFFGEFVYSVIRREVSDNVDWALGYVAESILVLNAFALMILATVIISRRFFCIRFNGEQPRDSWAFVQFMYYTKVMISTDVHLFQRLNGTPLMPLIYRLMGGRVSMSSKLFFRHCADFNALNIGDFAIVGFDSYLEMHQKTATTLVFETV